MFTQDGGGAPESAGDEGGDDRLRTEAEDDTGVGEGGQGVPRGRVFAKLEGGEEGDLDRDEAPGVHLPKLAANGAKDDERAEEHGQGYEEVHERRKVSVAGIGHCHGQEAGRAVPQLVGDQGPGPGQHQLGGTNPLHLQRICRSGA